MLIACVHGKLEAMAFLATDFSASARGLVMGFTSKPFLITAGLANFGGFVGKGSAMRPEQVFLWVRQRALAVGERCSDGEFTPTHTPQATQEMAQSQPQSAVSCAKCSPLAILPTVLLLLAKGCDGVKLPPFRMQPGRGELVANG